jgi:hypothetical protein
MQRMQAFVRLFRNLLKKRLVNPTPLRQRLREESLFMLLLRGHLNDPQCMLIEGRLREGSAYVIRELLLTNWISGNEARH